MERFLGIVTLLCFGLGWSSGEAAEQRIAVLEFSGTLSTDELIALGDSARAGVLEAVGGRPLLVMTRENTAQLLRDMGIDPDCVEGDCEVETGQRIGAHYVVSGQVHRIEGALRASVRLHETATRALLATDEVRSDSALQLITGIRTLARDLVLKGIDLGRSGAGHEGAIRGDLQELQEAGAAEVLVSFETRPQQASVLLDGRLLCASSPCTKSIAVGAHRLEVQAERHLPSEQILEVRGERTVHVALEPDFGWLTVRTEPAGLAVRLDGMPITPGDPLKVDPGLHEVVSADACHAADGERVRVGRGERREVLLRPRQRQARLRVRVSTPSGNAVAASVRVDGRTVGRSPGDFLVSVCAQHLAVVGPQGRRWKRRLALTEGETAVIDARLDAAPVRTKVQGERSARSDRAALRGVGVFLMFTGGATSHFALLTARRFQFDSRPYPTGANRGFAHPEAYADAQQISEVYLVVSGAGLGAFALGTGLYAASEPAPSWEPAAMFLLIPTAVGILAPLVTLPFSQDNPGEDPLTMSFAGAFLAVGVAALTTFATYGLSVLSGRVRARRAAARNPRPRVTPLAGPGVVGLGGTF